MWSYSYQVWVGFNVVNGRSKRGGLIGSRCSRILDSQGPVKPLLALQIMYCRVDIEPFAVLSSDRRGDFVSLMPGSSIQSPFSSFGFFTVIVEYCI